VLNTMNLFGLLKVESNLTPLIFGTTLTVKRTQLEYLGSVAQYLRIFKLQNTSYKLLLISY
jgi:hypothetical protein